MRTKEESEENTAIYLWSSHTQAQVCAHTYTRTDTQIKME